MSSIIIELRNLKFFAHHGLHAEEKKLGAEFLVEAEIHFPPEKNIINNIRETVDYAALFEVIRMEMCTPRELLETLVMETIERIHSSFPQLSFIRLSITKLAPPIPGLTGNMRVSFSREY